MNPRFVFILDEFDPSEGASTLATLADDDAPMTLETAIWAPELAGALGFPAWTVLDLRGAIRRNELRPERHGHRILVTRRQLREWRERVRIEIQAPKTPAPVPRDSRRDLEAALAIAERLKSSGRAKPKSALQR